MADVENSKNRALNNFAFDYSNIRDLLPHDQMPVTSNDIDLFMLEWRTGDWKYALNSKSFELGYNYKKRQIKDIKSESQRYQNSILNMSDKQLERMIGNYLRTLTWLTDYYMNADIETKQDYISTWSYNYHRSPMISHIVSYLNAIDITDLKKIIKNVYSKSLIHTSNYIKAPRHKLYIYPLSEEQLSLMNPNYAGVFPDIKKEVLKVLNQIEEFRKDESKKQNKYKMFFDCREFPYFSKCIFGADSSTFRELMKLDPDLSNSTKSTKSKGGHRYKDHKYGSIKIKKRWTKSNNSTF